MNFADITIFYSEIAHQIQNLYAQLLLFFSSREIAGIIWLCVLLLFVLPNASVRQAFGSFLKACCQRQIVVITLLVLIYITLEILLLRSLELWSTTNIKDTLIWILCSGFALIVQFVPGYENGKASFYTVVKNLIGIPILLEFFMNYYTFNIWIELILLPMASFLGAALALSKTRPELETAGKVSSRIIGSLGLLLFLYTIYKAARDGDLLSAKNGLQFFLPVTLTLLYLPFLYLIVLYTLYERYWMTFKFTFKSSSELIRTARIEHFKIAALNTNKVNRLGKVLLRCGWKIESKDQLLSLLRAFRAGHKFSVGERVLDTDLMEEAVVGAVQEDFIELKYPDGNAEAFHGSLKKI